MNDWNKLDESTQGYGTHRDSHDSRGIRDRAMKGVDEVRSKAGDVGGKAMSRFDRLFDDHPLTLGLGAMALGIAIGMMLPASRQEERWMGDASERVKERTRETASRFGDVAKSSLHEATDAARQEMEERGMSPEELRNDAKEVARKSADEAKRVAQEEAERNNLR